MADINFNDVTNATTIEDGTGYFDKLMNTVNIQIDKQYQKGRLKGSDYANVYLGSIQSAMVEAFKFALQEQLTEAQIEGTLQDNANKVKEGIKLDSETKLSNDQDSELLLNGVKDRDLINEKTLNEADKRLSTAKAREIQDVQIKEANRKYTENGEKWAISKGIMENQKATSDIDLQFKPNMATADLDQKHKTLDSMDADIAFNTSKKVIMEETRNDNVRMKAAEQYAEFLKYISAADAVPSKYHFQNLVGLIDSINDGMLDEDYKYNMLYKGDRQVNSKGEVLYYVKDANGNDTDEVTTNATDSNGNANTPAYYKDDVVKSPSASNTTA